MTHRLALYRDGKLWVARFDMRCRFNRRTPALAWIMSRANQESETV